MFLKLELCLKTFRINCFVVLKFLLNIFYLFLSDVLKILGYLDSYLSQCTSVSSAGLNG